MSPLATAIASVLVAHVLLNAFVTQKLVRSSAYEPTQKSIQIALLWLIPVLGVVAVLLFLQPGERPPAFIEHDHGDDDVPESLFAERSPSAGTVGASEGD